jgi:hypothetical protein
MNIMNAMNGEIHYYNVVIFNKCAATNAPNMTVDRFVVRFLRRNESATDSSFHAKEAK